MCLFALALGPSMADDDDDDDRRSRIVKCDKGKSLQKRLDKAKDGATIKVRGICEESIVIDKNRLTLMCKPGGGITGGTARSAVVVYSQNVTITGCDISIGGGTVGAIAVLRNGSAIITDNTIAGGAANGVTTSQGGYARVLDNTISGRTAVLASGNSVMDVARNIINTTRTGIFVANGSTMDIVGNTVTGPEPTGAFNTGLSIARNGVANLSNDASLGSDANIIQDFFRGIDCRTGSVVRAGALQDDDSGSNQFNLSTDGTCHLDLPNSANNDGFLPAPPP